jgi:hypothetical protein
LKIVSNPIRFLIIFEFIFLEIFGLSLITNNFIYIGAYSKYTHRNYKCSFSHNFIGEKSSFKSFSSHVDFEIDDKFKYHSN